MTALDIVAFIFLVSFIILVVSLIGLLLNHFTSHNFKHAKITSIISAILTCVTFIAADYTPSDSPKPSKHAVAMSKKTSETEESASTKESSSETSSSKEESSSSDSSEKTSKDTKSESSEDSKYTPVQDKIGSKLIDSKSISDNELIMQGTDISVSGTVVATQAIMDNTELQIKIDVPGSDQNFFTDLDVKHPKITQGDKITLYGDLNGHGTTKLGATNHDVLLVLTDHVKKD